MSSRSLRRVLSVSLVMAFLSLGSPASGAASTFFVSPDASFWELAWQWLTEQLSTTVEGEPAAPADQSDAGWILDPNG